MAIPTEPIGSIPRPQRLIDAVQKKSPADVLEPLFDEAVRDTLRGFEKTGSLVLTDGEQCKPSFVTYPIAGLAGLSDGGITIPFADGHQRQLPQIARGPFRYRVYADGYLARARKHTKLPVKQAVISPSAISLLYPAEGIADYSREKFLGDVVREAETDIRRCLAAGADSVQIDFTEGRLSLKLDPSGQLLEDFVAINNEVLGKFTEAERARIGVHTCPGGDHDSTHSLDVDYAELLPRLFQHRVGRFYLQLASEADPNRVLQLVAQHLPPGARVFVGVTDPIDPRVESPEEVRDRVLAAARHIPVNQLGTCDDCGFAPFGDDVSTSRELAFAKITARVRGTALAAKELGV
ncbi:cobalamin-independent methionine synthase II family protein [Pendulispora rubella]|uniref:Cobalamin-independent methionine synthase II family protein n=1 Tax=Pendulispora rubella TaxID=2741070 RepID=A0ABZ2L617_9BACT